ncbi:UNVERIFIED_CONTAM: hypothetical protein FKN15_049408 [Acipenser sinensis]
MLRYEKCCQSQYNNKNLLLQPPAFFSCLLMFLGCHCSVQYFKSNASLCTAVIGTTFLLASGHQHSVSLLQASPQQQHPGELKWLWISSSSCVRKPQLMVVRDYGVGETDTPSRTWKTQFHY